MAMMILGWMGCSDMRKLVHKMEVFDCFPDLMQYLQKKYQKEKQFKPDCLGICDNLRSLLNMVSKKWDRTEDTSTVCFGNFGKIDDL